MQFPLLEICSFILQTQKSRYDLNAPRMFTTAGNWQFNTMFMTACYWQINTLLQNSMLLTV